MTPQYRQGDLLMLKLPGVEVVKLDATSTVSPVGGRVILAAGEATGHTHSVDATAARLYEGAGADRYLHVEACCDLTHEEHGMIPLDVGWYRVIRQREWGPGMPGYVRD
jgi:hypothetical protein